MSEKSAKFFKKVDRGIEYAIGGNMGNDVGKFVSKNCGKFVSKFYGTLLGKEAGDKIGGFAGKLVGDFTAGAINGVAGAVAMPYNLADWIDRRSGLRDNSIGKKQGLPKDYYKKQAINELNTIKTGLKLGAEAISHDTTRRKMLSKYIWNDVKSRPAYYIGGLVGGGFIGGKVIPGKPYSKMFKNIPLIPAANIKDISTFGSNFLKRSPFSLAVLSANGDNSLNELFNNNKGLYDLFNYGPNLLIPGFDYGKNGYGFYPEGGKCFVPPFYKLDIYDPLVLDLNGDNNIDLITADDSIVYFNHKNDGVKVNTSWIGKDDGFLVIDKNNNGTIDNGSELFGNFTTKNNGDMANNGFEALKDYDTNGDLIIDYRDDKFGELKIWQDLNSDGISQSGELKTLKEAGISRLNLNNSETSNEVLEGNSITHAGSFVRNDGTTSILADVSFNVNTTDNIVENNTEVKIEDLYRANIAGMGRVDNLSRAIKLSKNLDNILLKYENAQTKEEQLNLLDGMLFEWAKTDTNFNNYNIEILKANETFANNNTNVATIRVTPTQARILREQISKGLTNSELINELNSIKNKIKIVSAFTGQNFSKIYYAGDNLLKDFINFINNTYENIYKEAYFALLPQTRLVDYLNKIKIIPQIDGSIKYDNSDIIAYFNQINTTNPKKAFTDLAEFITMFESKNDIKDGIALLSNFAIAAKEKGVIKEYLNTLSSETISDLSTQTGSLNNDTLIGSNILDGKDTLYGLDGDDTLIGGIGDDTLIGGKGSDTYLYEDKNFGNDIIINNSSNNLNNNTNSSNQSNNLNSNSSSNNINNNPFIKDKDIIKFKGNIKKEDIIYKRVMDNGVISDDLIILLKDEYDSLINNININNPNINNSNNKAYNPNSPIIDKSLLKNTNNSIFIKDFFKDDSSMISAIEFKNSDDIITKDTIINSLLTTSNLNDYINPFDKDKNYRIDSKDGNDTIITHNGNDTILAGNGNDTIDSGGGNDYIDGGSDDDDIYAGDGDDTLIGGSGNDTLQGGMGNDTYVFGRGFGNDVILNFNPNNETDTIKFIDGISQDELNFKSIDGNLVISFKDKSIKDTITISNFFKDKNYMITNIEFDKSYMSLSDIMNKVILSTDDSSNNINIIDDNSYVIDGKGGDDIITASSGNDIIIGGSGNDTLTGGLGSDTYKFDDNFGNDTIINYNPTLKDIDTIEFTSKNITKESLNFSKDKNDLLIVKDELNSIRVKDYFLLNYNKEPVNAINTIKFANKTTLSIEDIDKLLISNSSDKNDEISTISSKNFTINTKGGDDVITTNSGDDYIDGGSGNDIISSGSGDDILIGGMGNDTLNGGSGNDTYIFERGFGKDTIINYNPDLYTDTIEFKGINKDELTFKQIDSNLVISFKDATIKDSLTIKDFYKLDYKQRAVNAISKIKFNNEILNLKDINDFALNSISNDGDKISVVTSDDYVVNGGDDTKRYKFIKNLKILKISNKIITKKIYNFKSYEFVA